MGKLEKNISKNTPVNQNYKKDLKNASVMFIHYLLTYAEEIAKEKNRTQIAVVTLKEALLEANFSEIVLKIEESSKNQLPSDSKFKKRDLASFQDSPEDVAEQEEPENTGDSDPHK